MFGSLRKKIGCVCLALVAVAFAGCGIRKPVITLDKRNGEPLERVEAPYRGAQTYRSGTMLFPNPTRKGWFFDGWFLDEACTQSAYDVPVNRDVTFYAGWTDRVTVPYDMPTWRFKDYGDLFTVTTKAEPYTPLYGIPRLKLTLSVTPKGDYTGRESTDRIELQITHYWLSDEKFLDEYVSEEVVAYVGVRDVWLEKEKGYALKDEVILVDYNNEHLEHPIYSYTFANPHVKSEINYIFYEPTLQFNHETE